jgi:tripartite-type tricarboxylate transporter receptor subunit TctC
MGTMKKSKKLMWLFCLLFLLIYFLIQTPKVSYTEEKYPTRTIKFIVPFTAGSGTDIISRKLSDLVGKSIGQEIIVENKPGGGGIIGSSFIAKSKADGYTVGAAASGTFLTGPFLAKIDFDPLIDLTPIVQVFSTCAYICVTADSPIKTFDDFIEAGRKRQILVGCTGMVISDIALQRLGTLAKINIKLVPFGGASRCVAPLLGGQVDAVVTAGGFSEYVRAGKVRMIVRLTEVSKKEFKDLNLPDIPHVKEYGYDVDAPGFIGIFGPKGLPISIHTKLEEEFTRAVLNPSIIQFMNDVGSLATYRNSKDFGVFLKEGHERAREMIKELGLGIYAKEKK